MDTTGQEFRENSWTLSGLDDADLQHAATEQIDWNSFVDLEYDPTIPTASTQGPLACSEESFQNSSNNNGIPNDKDFTYDAEDLSSFAPLELPSMDEWWAELPDGVEAAELDSSTGASLYQGDTPRSDSNSSAYVDWISPGLEEGEAPRKRRRRMPPEAKRLLTECFERHKEDPYIPKDDVQRLATETGLSLRQVQTFFANARARKLPRPPKDSKAVEIPVAPDQQGPMERFLSSSPEDEGISENALTELDF
ncbi:hypothetical protein N0V90_002445 [Kalmusia sp. IMI 367209]|nr:hypothetical protein N0V90_002445 [Kalmusia sp. IMI 367209]